MKTLQSGFIAMIIPASPFAGLRKGISVFVPQSNAGSEAHLRRRPLKEVLWNISGVIFYLLIAGGVVYHFVLPLF